MSTIDPRDIGEFVRIERAFWRTVRQTFSYALRASPYPMDVYRLSLLEASPQERLLAMHDDPLDLASTLSGVEITPDIEFRYAKLREQEELTSFLIRLKGQAGEPLEEPSYFPRARHVVDWERTSGLISLQSVAQTMNALGYYDYAQIEDTILWGLNDSNTRAGLPPVVALALPAYRTVHGEPAYQVETVAAFFANIVALAEDNSAPASTIKFVQQNSNDLLNSFE